MIKLYDTPVYLVNGTEIVEDNAESTVKIANITGKQVSKE